MRGEIDIGIGLIVPQQNIVGRPQRFDQILFQQQRFCFTAGNSDFNGRNLAHQGFGFRGQA